MSENKKISNCLYLLIKEDLRDFLNNKKRLEKGWYFFPYDDMSGKIWVIENRGKGVIISSEIENLVRENARANASHRQEEFEKLWAREIEKYKKRGITLKKKKFKLDEKEIWEGELEKKDYDEIVNLISQVKQASDINDQSRRRKREEKLSSHPHLFYWSSNKHINPLFINKWKGEKYRHFLKKLTEKECRGLNINSLHPALNNFPFEKEGFYIIEGTNNLPWQPSSHNGTNFSKFVELNDQITISPYEIENDSELSKKEKAELGLTKDCDICQKNENEMDNGTEKWYTLRHYHGQKSDIIQTCSNCYKNKEQEYLKNYEFIFSFPKKDLTHEGVPFDIKNIKGGKIDCYAGKKDHNGKILKQENCSHCQPWKKFENPNSHESEKEIINWLIQYFQTNNIRQIELENGQLAITNNNNNNKEIKTQTQINNDYRLEDIQNWLQKKGQKTLTYQDLEKFNNSPTSSSRSPKTDYTPYLIGGGIVLITLGVVLISYLFIRKVK